MFRNSTVVMVLASVMPLMKCQTLNYEVLVCIQFDNRTCGQITQVTRIPY